MSGLPQAKTRVKESEEGVTFTRLRKIWKAGCLETCTSGLGLGAGCNSPLYTTITTSPLLTVKRGGFERWQSQEMIDKKQRKATVLRSFQDVQIPIISEKMSENMFLRLAQ